jgi:hypothetical protein
MKVLVLIVAAICASVLAATARADAPANLFDGAGVFLDNPGTSPARGALQRRSRRITSRGSPST